MTVFKYPRCILIATDDDRPVVVAKMRKARKKWACMSRIIGQEGENVWAIGKLFKYNVHTFFLFSLETWVVNPRTRRTLGGFQHRVNIHIMG